MRASLRLSEEIRAIRIAAIALPAILHAKIRGIDMSHQIDFSNFLFYFIFPEGYYSWQNEAQASTDPALPFPAHKSLFASSA